MLWGRGMSASKFLNSSTLGNADNLPRSERRLAQARAKKLECVGWRDQGPATSRPTSSSAFPPSVFLGLNQGNQ
jgi:hypothetical protein